MFIVATKKRSSPRYYKHFTRRGEGCFYPHEGEMPSFRNYKHFTPPGCTEERWKLRDTRMSRLQTPQ